MLRRSLLVLLAVLAFLAPGARAQAPRPAPVRAVDSVAFNVTDLDRSVAWYSEVLGFQKDSEAEVDGEAYEHLTGVFGLRLRVARLHLGDEHLELQQFLAPRGRPAPVDFRSNDRWFQHVAIIVSDMDKAYARLRSFKVEHASSGPQLLPAWNPDAGGISAFYFRDPDGNVLEILHFPAGKGLPKWHQATDRLFLGIDHTAIVVSDTEASLRLYRDLLGLKVVGGAENHGTEQEHLNNVFGARLRITALRAESGFGVEFLEYLAPRTGRPAPGDTQANDRWWGQINFTAPAVEAPLEALRGARHTLVSPGAVDLPGAALGARRGLLAKDADGHGLLFRQQ